MKNNQSDLTNKQIQCLKNDIRQKYRNGTLEQELIDALEADPDWKWEPNKPKTTKKFKAELAKINSKIKVFGEYTSAKAPIDVRCTVCGYTWLPRPYSLLSGCGCPKCAGNAHKTTKQFIAELAEVNSTIQVLGKYKNAHALIKVRCKVCDHTWSPIPLNLKHGHGCPKCAHKHQTQKLSKLVRCIETGEVYPSQTIAAHSVGLKTSTPINLVLHGRAKTAAGYHWEYADTT